MIPIRFSTIKAVSSAILTQALSSSTNFAFNLYLLRMMSAEEFGLFGIGFAIVMILNGFWQGFFITQYIVLAPGENYTRFPAQVYAALLFVSAGAAGIVLIAAAILEYFSDVGMLAVGIGFSAIAFSMKEFHIRRAFSVGKGFIAIWINAVMGISLTIMLTIFWYFEIRFGAELSFAIYAVGVVMSALAGHALSGLPLRCQRYAEVLITLRKLSAGGNWAIANNIIFSLRNNAHIIVLSALLGPVAVASVNAARLFVTPPIMLLPALSNIILPSFSRALRNHGKAGLRKLQAGTLAALIAFSALYSSAIIVLWNYIEGFIVDDSYEGIFSLVIAWLVFTSVLILRNIVDWGTQAERRFALITKVSLGVAFVALVAAWLLTVEFGALGAVFALVLAELLMAYMLWVTQPERL